MKKIILLSLIATITLAITFPLSSTRQTCLQIKQKGVYELEYIVSGQNPSQYTCSIYSNQLVIQSIQQVTQYEKLITFNSTNNKICFSALDDQMKQVSFDIISTQDPLKNHFSVKDQEQTHMKMYAAFQQLQKVYRDQNMFIERSTIYMNLLFDKQIKIVFVLIFKIVVALALGGYQLLLIKQIVTNKTYGYSLPPGIRTEQQSDDQMD